MSKPFHPFLLVIYPVLFLYSQNMDEFPLSVTLAPVLILLAVSIFICAILWKCTRNQQRSFFLFSVFVAFCFSYGHFIHLLEQTELLRYGFLGDQKIILSIYGVILAIVLAVSYFAIRNWNIATRFLNALGIFLTLAILIQIASGSNRTASESAVSDLDSVSLSGSPDDPDIFYIILDGYPRADVLKELHDFDNSSFLSFLKHHNFQVLNHSHSNYPGTSLSLASSLNFSYLSDYIPDQMKESGNRWLLTDLIQRNKVMSILKQRGYITVAFDSGYFATELKNADRFYATGWFLNEFHEAFLDTTPAFVFFKNLGRHEVQRKRILYILSELPSVRDNSKPAFVFAHIMALHPPFVFGPNGEELDSGSSLQFWKDFGEPTRSELSKQYKDQLTFMNKLISDSIEKTLQQRRRPCLIILQGDHGSSFLSESDPGFYRERFSILNAIRWDKIQPEHSMSSVNTFRVVLNSLFQMNLPLLPDRSYYSSRHKPYDLHEVTDRLSLEPEH